MPPAPVPPATTVGDRFLKNEDARDRARWIYPVEKLRAPNTAKTIPSSPSLGARGIFAF
jgi:hypothetical protein